MAQTQRARVRHLLDWIVTSPTWVVPLPMIAPLGAEGVRWLAESVCWPRVANTTRTVALPLTNVTVAGSLAAASVEVRVAVPPWERRGFPSASSARIVTVTGTPAGTARGSVTANLAATGAAVTLVVIVLAISPAAPPRTERV